MACCSFQQAMIAVVLTMVASIQQFRSACYRWRSVSIPTFLIVCDAREASASVSKCERAWASVSEREQAWAWVQKLPRWVQKETRWVQKEGRRAWASVSKREQAWASVSTSPQLVFTCIKLSFILIDQALVLVRLGLVSYPWHKTLRSRVFWCND